MMVTIFRCWRQKTYVAEIFMHVGDIPIGHQHHNMPDCDVGDRYVMLELIFCHLKTDPEGLTSVTNIIIRQNVMLVTEI